MCPLTSLSVLRDLIRVTTHHCRADVSHCQYISLLSERSISPPCPSLAKVIAHLFSNLLYHNSKYHKAISMTQTTVRPAFTVERRSLLITFVLDMPQPAFVSSSFEQPMAYNLQFPNGPRSSHADATTPPFASSSKTTSHIQNRRGALLHTHIETAGGM